MSKVSVITGGAGGMGLATARIVGRSRHVVIADVRQDRLDLAADELRAAGVTTDAVTCDVTDRRSVEQMADFAGSIGNVVSVLHTAGVSPKMAAADVILRINALGTVHVNETFLKLAAPGLSIVNVASSAGHLPSAFPVPRTAYEDALTDPARFLRKMISRCNLAPQKLRPSIAYSLSKNFVLWYTKRNAANFGERGARIVSVSPGSIDTEMGRLEEASGAGLLAASSAMHRFGTVDEIAEVLAFCASEGPSYLTGTDILVDGGAAATMTVRSALAMARKISETSAT